MFSQKQVKVSMKGSANSGWTHLSKAGDPVDIDGDLAIYQHNLVEPTEDGYGVSLRAQSFAVPCEALTITIDAGSIPTAIGKMAAWSVDAYGGKTVERIRSIVTAVLDESEDAIEGTEVNNFKDATEMADKVVSEITEAVTAWRARYLMRMMNEWVRTG